MIKRMVIVLLVLALVFGGIFGFEAFKGVMIKKFMATLTNPVQTVSTITAVTQPWQTNISATGSLRAAQGADLSAEINGIVDEFCSAPQRRRRRRTRAAPAPQ